MEQKKREKETIADRSHKSTWCGRSLDNYKAMHKGTAEKKGVGGQLATARTLTAAKKIVFGVKKGNDR